MNRRLQLLQSAERFATHRRPRWPALALLALGYTCQGAQQHDDTGNTKVSQSDLEQRNLTFAAASAEQIKAVLLQDPGLMVEIKRWVAKDAADNGQVIGESDLSDDAIFDRMENDVPFRARVTLILQQYGYLAARVNPDSPLGKQQDLLIQERVKWLIQQEEQERARANQNLETTQSCSTTANGQCRPASRGGTDSPTMDSTSAPETSPRPPASQQIPEQPVPATPATDSALERAGLMQNLAQYPLTADLSIFGLSSGADFGPMASSIDGNSLRLTSQRTEAMGQLTGGSLLGLATGSTLIQPGIGDPNGVGDAVTIRQTNIASGEPSAQQARYTNPNFQRPSEDIRADEPRMVRVKNPYDNIPSLYDMYLQASPHPAEPRRFGSEVFADSSRSLEAIPMDLPAGPDYVVGPGDGLEIDLWGGVSQRLERIVDREGRVTIPEAGPILVSGKSLADVQDSMQRMLRGVFRDESANVSLSRLRTVRVYEVGDVVHPGAYDVSSLSTPLNALFAAGGPTARGSLRVVQHYRGNQLIEEVDLYDLLLRGVRNGMARIENGDTVRVPPVGAQVTVDGMVRRPAVYELKDEHSLSSVLELAGGLLPAATLRHIEVQRLVAPEKQTMLSVDLPGAQGDATVTQRLDAFTVQDGDRIRVFPIAAYNEDAVYLDGHVLRPGRYSYHANMRVTDLIASYKDLLPEPATDYAEIIRLNAPDFRPSVVSFSVAKVMENPSAAPILRPLDTVRIFSRFDFEDPPTVSVAGDVRMPGTYQTSGQIHLSDALHLAGGLAPDSGIEDAQVFRYAPDEKSTIFSVNLSAALAGDAAADILLQPRDRLLIHQSPNAVEPATVYVQGAVGRPGRYPLATNMTVGDLIRVGGGLKPSADTQSADLIRYQLANGDAANFGGRRELVSISAALAGDRTANVTVHNGDVLTVREAAGWSDLGASITLKGEVNHPGTYGIRPGERLSSIIERAGGFAAGAYPYGAVLQRVQVRDLERKQQDELILRVKDEQTRLEVLPETDEKAKQAKDTALQQYQATLTRLTANPPLGRVAIRISDHAERWKNTAADVEVRAGDMLTVPKRPGYVMVNGQVFNPTAVSYRPSHSAKWYLSQAGGPTAAANRKAIFVVRADGSVIGGKESLWSGDPLGAALRPGDTVIVPEKAIGGGPNWQNLFTATQLASSIVSTTFIALHY